MARTDCSNYLISFAANSPLIKIISFGRKKPIFLFPLLSFYNRLHLFRSAKSAALLSTLRSTSTLSTQQCLELLVLSERGTELGERWAGSMEGPCCCFCKTYTKGHIWQPERELQGNLCREMRGERWYEGIRGTSGLSSLRERRGTQEQCPCTENSLLGIPVAEGRGQCLLQSHTDRPGGWKKNNSEAESEAGGFSAPQGFYF